MPNKAMGCQWEFLQNPITITHLTRKQWRSRMGPSIKCNVQEGGGASQLQRDPGMPMELHPQVY